MAALKSASRAFMCLGSSFCLQFSPGIAAEPLVLQGAVADHAVLQRNAEISLHGSGIPGSTVTARLANREVSGPIDAHGIWRLVLPPMAEGGPFDLQVTSSGATLTIRDLLIGDVFLCSGQSNMALPVSRTLNAPVEIEQAYDQGIRLTSVPFRNSVRRQETFERPLLWRDATPTSVSDFSAVCYYTARELRKIRNVPLGLVNASWGGTQLDAWRPDSAFNEQRDWRFALLRLYARDPVTAGRRWADGWWRWWRTTNAIEGVGPLKLGEGNDWKPVPILASWREWSDPAVRQPKVAVLYKAILNVSAAQATRPATLMLGVADDYDVTWLNGVGVGSSDGADLTRGYRLGSGALKAGRNEIVVAIVNGWATGGLTAPVGGPGVVFADGSTAKASQWFYQVSPPVRAQFPRPPWHPPTSVSTLHNGMIAPLGDYRFAGVLWYQGEQDRLQWEGYRLRLAALMREWRMQFGNPALPFIVTQLSTYGERLSSTAESGLASVREEQRQAVLTDKHAALVVTVDLGEASDIHPANKQEVGRRMARATRAVVYGETIAPTGPEVSKVSREALVVALEFAHVQGGLKTLGAANPVGFQLCGAKPGSCRWTEARSAYNVVRLSIGNEPFVTRVRYCWADTPVCNLVDSEGMPVGPFEVSVPK